MILRVTPYLHREHDGLTRDVSCGTVLDVLARTAEVFPGAIVDDLRGHQVSIRHAIEDLPRWKLDEPAYVWPGDVFALNGLGIVR